MKYGTDNKGYYRCCLSKNGNNKTVKVHRIVAETFIPNPNNLAQVNHIDGNKQNNNVDNLEWCSQSENMKHAYKNGLKKINGERNPASKLSIEDVVYIRTHYIKRDKNFSTVALAKRYGVNRRTIERVVKYKSWNEKQNEPLPASKEST